MMTISWGHPEGIPTMVVDDGGLATMATEVGDSSNNLSTTVMKNNDVGERC